MFSETDKVRAIGIMELVLLLFGIMDNINRAMRGSK
jgi:hypothetical protein